MEDGGLVELGIEQGQEDDQTEAENSECGKDDKSYDPEGIAADEISEGIEQASPAGHQEEQTHDQNEEKQGSPLSVTFSAIIGLIPLDVNRKQGGKKFF